MRRSRVSTAVVCRKEPADIPSRRELHRIFLAFGLEAMLACLQGTFLDFVCRAVRVGEELAVEACEKLRVEAAEEAKALARGGHHVEAVRTFLATNQYFEAGQLALESLAIHRDPSDRVRARLLGLFEETVSTLLAAGQLSEATELIDNDPTCALLEELLEEA